MAYALQFQKTDVVSNFNGITTGTGAITLTSGNFSASGTQLYVIDYDTANAEVVSATVSGTTLTLVARGLDGTSAVTHTAGAKIGAFFVPSHYSILSNHMEDGWVESPDTWVYASASTFTISGVDRTSTYQKGTKLRFKQGGGYKYAVVASSSFSTNTTVTIAVNSDYTIANSAITDNDFSYVENPVGWVDWFTYSPVTIVGFSSTPSDSVYKYRIQGRTIEIFFNLSNGATTSNSATTSFTAPVTAITLTGYEATSACRIYDNGAWQAGAGLVSVTSNSNVVTLGKALTGTGGFTASGGKTALGWIQFQF